MRRWKMRQIKKCKDKKRREIKTDNTANRNKTLQRDMRHLQ